MSGRQPTDCTAGARGVSARKGREGPKVGRALSHLCGCCCWVGRPLPVIPALSARAPGRTLISVRSPGGPSRIQGGMKTALTPFPLLRALRRRSTEPGPRWSQRPRADAPPPRASRPTPPTDSRQALESGRQRRSSFSVGHAGQCVTHSSRWHGTRAQCLSQPLRFQLQPKPTLRADWVQQAVSNLYHSDVGHASLRASLNRKGTFGAASSVRLPRSVGWVWTSNEEASSLRPCYRSGIRLVSRFQFRFTLRQSTSRGASQTAPKASCSSSSSNGDRSSALNTPRPCAFHPRLCVSDTPALITWAKNAESLAVDAASDIQSDGACSEGIPQPSKMAAR